MSHERLGRLPLRQLPRYRGVVITRIKVDVLADDIKGVQHPPRIKPVFWILAPRIDLAHEPDRNPSFPAPFHARCGRPFR